MTELHHGKLHRGQNTQHRSHLSRNFTNEVYNIPDKEGLDDITFIGAEREVGGEDVEGDGECRGREMNEEKGRWEKRRGRRRVAIHN